MLSNLIIISLIWLLKLLWCYIFYSITFSIKMQIAVIICISQKRIHFRSKKRTGNFVHSLLSWRKSATASFRQSDFPANEERFWKIQRKFHGDSSNILTAALSVLRFRHSSLFRPSRGNCGERATKGELALSLRDGRGF